MVGRQIRIRSRVLGTQKGHEASPAGGIRVRGRGVGVGLVKISKEVVVLLVMRMRRRVRDKLGLGERVGPSGRGIRR